MLSKDTLKEFTRKFQTTEINVIREYIPLLLSYFIDCRNQKNYYLKEELP